MPSRQADWMDQAERDLEVAQKNAFAGYYEWACFAAHQAAEKGVKAVYQYLGGEARGHDLDGLLHGLSGRVRVPKILSNRVTELGKYYIGTRYPDAHADGAPFRHYTRIEALRAIGHAKAVIGFCKNLLAEP